MDVADSINRNIETKSREMATRYLRNQIEERVKIMTCKSCGSVTYSIKDFSYNPNSIVAHLKCDKCGFEGEFVGNYILDIEEAQKGISESIHDLQKTIADINREMNK